MKFRSHWPSVTPSARVLVRFPLHVILTVEAASGVTSAGHGTGSIPRWLRNVSFNRGFSLRLLTAAQLVDMHPRRLLLAAPARLSHLSPQQPVMHSGFLTSGRGSPTNMLRFGILTALSVLASSVASAGISPFRLRM
jgi:hypothetical protein